MWAILLAFLLPFATAASEKEYFTFKQKKGCYIKRSVGGKYIDVPYSTVGNSTVHAIRHPKSPRFYVFKLGGQVHVTPDACVVALKDELLDHDKDLDDLENKETYERINRREASRVPLTAWRNKKYSFSLLLGKPFYLSTNPALSSADAEDGFDGLGYDFLRFGAKSKASSSYLMGVEFSFRSTDTLFYSFSLSRHSAQRKDNYIIDDGGNVVNAAVKAEERHTSLGGGPRWFFIYLNEYLRPFVGARLGLSDISQDYGGVKYSSSGFYLAPETGIEFSISDDFALSLRADYELHMKRKFRLKGGKETSNSFEGYASEANYSNYKLILGFTYYL